MIIKFLDRTATMTNLHRMARPFSAVLLLLAVAACAPKITRFDVLPVHVCHGTPSAVTWKISGSPEITTAPAIPPLQGEPLRYEVTEDTEFTLTAKRWPHRPDVSQTEVRVYETAAVVQEQVVFQMTCEGASLVGILPRPATEWDPRIRLETVSSDGLRDITIEHEGRSVALSASAPSTRAFQGATMAGTWKVTTPVGLTERCGDPTAAPPARIILSTVFVCTR